MNQKISHRAPFESLRVRYLHKFKAFIDDAELSKRPDESYNSLYIVFNRSKSYVILLFNASPCNNSFIKVMLYFFHLRDQIRNFYNFLWSVTTG